ncbi:hypothetical protein KKF84_03220 [Myxococcota bacterium]|nr:hypothetical protein [Myxococcota bacterium]MBU1534301.1 hypothetical protein [Myxococcota bacterium]
MRRIFTLTTLFSLFFTLSAHAADDFESRYKRTIHVNDLETVLGPFLQKCGKGNDLPQLQCRAIRSYMQRKISTQLYSAFARDEALTFGNYNNTKFEYPVTIKGCLTCGSPTVFDPLLFAQNKFWVVTTPPKSFKNGTFQGVSLGKFTIPVDPRNLEGWTKKVKPFLRVQFLFKVQTAGVWKEKDGHGITLYLGGYRVYNRCTGKVLFSEPASSGKAPVDTAGCKLAATNANPKVPTLPKMPKSSKIRELMRSIRDKAVDCYKQFQIPGTAKLKVYVSGSTGKVSKVVLSGDYKDTPTGTCVLNLVNSLNFGKFRKKQISFKYKYELK